MTVTELSTDVRIEDLLREVTPQVLASLVRRYGRFDTCEDAVQEALLAAATQWPEQGVPDNPRGWLITVAGRRLTDQWRGDQARRRREATAAALTPVDEFHAPAPEDGQDPAADDTAGRSGPDRHPGRRPTDGRQPPGGLGPRPPAGDGGRQRRGP
jgi:predicted RNA polymerase sigma factor